jgi:hypothetical protein
MPSFCTNFGFKTLQGTLIEANQIAISLTVTGKTSGGKRKL